VILAAAIRLDGVIHTLPAPARHHDIIRFMAVDLGMPTPITGEQGFLADYQGQARFANRIQAKAMASRSGQILEGKGLLRELFSEDLW